MLVFNLALCPACQSVTAADALRCDSCGAIFARTGEPVAAEQGLAGDPAELATATAGGATTARPAAARSSPSARPGDQAAASQGDADAGDPEIELEGGAGWHVRIQADTRPEGMQTLQRAPVLTIAGRKRGWQIAWTEVITALVIIAVGSVAIGLVEGWFRSPTVHRVIEPPLIGSLPLMHGRAVDQVGSATRAMLAGRGYSHVVTDYFSGDALTPQLLLVAGQSSAYSDATPPDALLGAIDQGMSLDPTTQTDMSRGGLTYRCLRLTSAETPVAVCSWRDLNVFGVAMTLGSTDLDAALTHAEQAHDASER